MSILSNFFKGSDTSLGIFYPRHYLIAVFGSLDIAQNVAAKLSLAGFAEGEVIAVPGKEVIELAKEETGLASFLMQAASRFFATEQIYTDHDLEHAHHGSGFLAVHCPTEDVKKDAWAIVEPAAPLDARFYGVDGIDHLAGDVDTD